MKIKKIYYSSRFCAQFKLLPKHIQKKALKQEQFFRDNPFHPSLRLHKLEGNLSGHWSLSIDRFYRIIFAIDEKGDIVFASVGTHAIYGK